MPDSNSKPPIIVISNAASGGGGKDNTNKDGIKLGNMKLPTGTLVTIASLLGLGLVGLYAVSQFPAVNQWIQSQFPPTGADKAGGDTAVSGTSAPIPPADVSTYPGTGAGTFPPPAVTQPGVPGTYANTTQGYPIPIPYATSPTAAQSALTPMPISPLGTSVVRSYHAHIDPERGQYMDHRGKRRSFINEIRIEEVIGSEQETKRVLDLDEN